MGSPRDEVHNSTEAGVRGSGLRDAERRQARELCKLCICIMYYVCVTCIMCYVCVLCIMLLCHDVFMYYVLGTVCVRGPGVGVTGRRAPPGPRRAVLGGAQTGSYQTGSYQKGRFIPPKPKCLYLLFLIRPCLYASDVRPPTARRRRPAEGMRHQSESLQS